jgi:hypothetical protein
MEDAAEVDQREVCYMFVTDCFPSTFTTYPDWVTYGKPDCWCNSAIKPSATGNYQCDGDGDGAVYGYQKYRVYSPDLTLLVNNWKKTIAQGPNPCADYDHKAYGYQKYRVYSPDLTILVNKWKKTDSGLPGNCGTLARPE